MFNEEAFEGPNEETFEGSKCLMMTEMLQISSSPRAREVEEKI